MVRQCCCPAFRTRNRGRQATLKSLASSPMLRFPSSGADNLPIRSLSLPGCSALNPNSCKSAVLAPHSFRTNHSAIRLGRQRCPMPERKAMTITPKTRQKPSVSQTILRTHDEAVRSALDSVKSMDVRELRNPTAPGSSDVIYDGANFGPATPRVRASRPPTTPPPL